MSDRTAVLKAALDLNPDERRELAMDIWDSIDPASVPLSDDQKAILDSRLKNYRADTGKTKPWEDVRDRLLKDS